MDHLISYSYTVPEIDRMRRAVDDLIFPTMWHSRYHGSEPATRPGEREQRVEEQLRTYMLNGTRPEELEKLAIERHDESEQQRLSFPEERIA